VDFALQGALLGISAALNPGPFQSLVIAQALLGNWRRVLPIVFAPLIGDLPIAFVLVFILTKVTETFLRYVRFAGAALLLFLAWGIWKQLNVGTEISTDADEPPLNARRGLIMGIAMLFMSPGPYLYWSLILGPLLLSALSISLWQAFAFLLTFYIFSIGGLILIAYLVSTLGKLNIRLHAWLQRSSLVLMLIIAVFLLIDGFRT
jgi:threonine/homoserine/homoserine lactone efflux protein